MPQWGTTTLLRTSNKRTPAQAAHALGYRSGLEDSIGASLQARGVVAEYETLKLEFTTPAKRHFYHPDWRLPNGIIVESKGRFLTADRQKHLLVKQQHPHLDIRFVFSRAATRLSKLSRTTYAMWCEKHGFRYADRDIPDAWLKEPPK